MRTEERTMRRSLYGWPFLSWYLIFRVKDREAKAEEDVACFAVEFFFLPLPQKPELSRNST